VGDTTRWKVEPLLQALGVTLILGVLFIGMYPGPAFEVSEEAAKPLFERSSAAGIARAP
jgi:hypothetical protein